MVASNTRLKQTVGMTVCLAGSNGTEALEIQSEIATAAWISYGAARLYWRSENKVNTPEKGVPVPATYEEELFSRQYLLSMWRKLKGEKDAKDLYLDTLEKVERAEFLDEYVHRYLVRNPKWEDSATNTLSEFDKWCKKNLADHVPLTAVGIVCK
jgi:hypothetical protein